jgi:putative oxidoreductase
MTQLSKLQTAVSWLLQLSIAGILFQTLFFKFTGADESVYIFSAVGRFVHIPAFEPWGRFATGFVELIAATLLLFPGTVTAGAMLTIGVMVGAIASHALVLGVDVKGDGGLLFGLALAAFAGSVVVVILRRAEMPVVGRYFQLA